MRNRNQESRTWYKDTELSGFGEELAHGQGEIMQFAGGGPGTPTFPTPSNSHDGNRDGFSDWKVVYEGPGKAFESTDLAPGKPYEFRVKTIGWNIVGGGTGDGLPIPTTTGGYGEIVPFPEGAYSGG